jgi:hypothetical protein
MHILVPTEGLDSEEGMKLDPGNIKSDPEYIRGLIAKAGVTQEEAAASICVAPRTIANWLGGEAKWPYSAQHALECLVRYGVKK